MATWNHVSGRLISFVIYLSAKKYVRNEETGSLRAREITFLQADGGFAFILLRIL